MTLPLRAIGQAAVEFASEFERAFDLRSLPVCECDDDESDDAVTELHDAAETILAARLRQRVANRIADSREKDLIPAKLPSSEQQAIALIKSTALELHAAGEALDLAARALLNVTGQGRYAQAAKLAGKRAKDAAEGLIGG